MGLTYKDSGVDIEAGNSFVKQIAPVVKATFDNRVITDLGGFGALYNGSFPEMKEPILVSGTDGVGTKLQIAKMMDRHDTIGIDAVAMCVNDILTSGAQPLFFLDYLACGKIREKVMVDIVKGLAEGCTQAGCSLVGGETAEHPNVMPDDDYDIAGFSVGVVDKSKIIDGKKIKPGQIVIGIASSGIHSNGYSFVRKLFFDKKKYSISTKIDELGSTLGENLLTPTRIYCKQLLQIIKSGNPVNGLVHITGGGFYENIPRILPEGTAVEIIRNSYELPPIFSVIQKEGDVSEREMYTTFNMGIGLVLFTTPEAVNTILDQLSLQGEKAWILGEVKESDKREVVLV